MPCFTMRRGTLHSPLVALRQLAGPLGHHHRIDLRMAQPNAAQVLMHRAEMESKLRRHSRIGSAIGMGEKGYGYTAASGWQSPEQARQWCGAIWIGGGFHFMLPVRAVIFQRETYFMLLIINNLQGFMSCGIGLSPW
jgi:hypothetical protein